MDELARKRCTVWPLPGPSASSNTSLYPPLPALAMISKDGVGWAWWGTENRKTVWRDKGEKDAKRLPEITLEMIRQSVNSMEVWREVGIWREVRRGSPCLL